MQKTCCAAAQQEHNRKERGEKTIMTIEEAIELGKEYVKQKSKSHHIS